jgi:hypothetical protein
MNSEEETNKLTCIYKLPYTDKLTLYQTLMTHRQHAEKIFWSRIQTLHIIQAAVLGGGYYLWKDKGLGLSVALIFVGILLTLLLGRLACNDWSDASVNKELMCKLESALKFNRAAKRKCLLSHSILFSVIGLFLTLDIVSILFLLVVRVPR